VLFAAVAYVLSHRPGFALRQLWYLSLATVMVQLGVNLWLLRREFGRRLSFEPAAVSPQGAAAAS
jgi:MATE family, multidrug efflux pump